MTDYTNLLQTYKSYLAGRKNSEKTITKKESQVIRYLSFLEETGAHLGNANLIHARGYMKKITEKYRPETVEHKRYILDQFYTFLTETGEAEENLFSREYFRPRKQKRIYSLTPDQKLTMNRYLRFQKIRKRNIDIDVTDLKRFFTYLNDYDIDFLRLKVGDAEQYQGHLITLKKESGGLVYSSKSVINVIGRLSVFYDYLVKQEITSFNPFKEIKRVKPGKSLPRNILDEEKLHTLLAGLQEKITTGKDIPEKRRYYRWHVLAEIMYSAGARINEAVKIQEYDIDFDRGTVLLRDDKTGKERYGFLNSYVCDIIKMYLKNRKILLVGKSNPAFLFGGDASVRKMFNRDMQVLSEELGLGTFKSHNLRHSFGYHMLRAGCDIRYIQEFLGHESPGTTQIYTKIDRNDLKHVLDTYHPRKIRRIRDHETP